MLRWWPRTVKLITGQMQETAVAATEQLLAKDTVPGPGISSEEDVGVGAEFQTTCIQQQGFSGQKDVPSSLFSSRELQPGRALCSHGGLSQPAHKVFCCQAPCLCPCSCARLLADGEEKLEAKD